MTILLSIITVSFNSKKTIRETIESVVSVKDNSIEYIVIDGGSRDGTQQIIAEYQPHIDYFISEKDKGIYDAMNKGLSRALGKYCLFLNSDDFLDIDGFKSALQVIRTNLDGWYFGNVRVISEEGTPLGLIKPKLQDQNSNHHLFMPVAHPGTIMETALLQKIGGFKLNFGGGGDYDLVLRYLQKYGKGQKLELTLTNYRLGGVSALPSYKKLKEHWRIWTAHNYAFSIKVRQFARELISIVLNNYFPGFLKALKKLKNENYISPL